MTITREQLRAILKEYVHGMKQLGDEQKAELDKIVHDLEQKRIAEIHHQINQIQ